MNEPSLKTNIISYAQSLGFGRVGITSAARLESAESSLGAWVQAGCAGDMAYMEKNWETRARPEERLSGAKCVITLAVSYYSDGASPTPQKSGGPSPSPACGPERPSARRPDGRGDYMRLPRVARYAWGKDYHRVLDKRLKSLVRYMEALAPEARFKSYIDTGPLLERALAQKAGLGFIGKNTMLITRGLGSWVFLASVLTTLDLPLDGPDTRSCGSCTLCIDACPTQAITEPYHLDARRCISYLTIESKEPIPKDLRPQTGDWLFGCDICQDVCPHNTRIPETVLTEFMPADEDLRALDLSEILAIKNEAEFDERFSQTAMKRAKRYGVVRNACYVAANQHRTDLLPLLQTLAKSDPHPVVRESASWAVDQLKTTVAAS